MLLWLIAVAMCVALWGLMWRASVELAFGVLIGVLLAWILSRLILPNVIAMEEFPVWVPPLPMATVAVLLFIYGAVVWFRGNDALPKGKADEHDDHGH
jgi:hypothetical protein